MLWPVQSILRSIATAHRSLHPSPDKERLGHAAGNRVSRLQQTFGCPILRSFCEGWDTTTVCVEIPGFPPLPESTVKDPGFPARYLGHSSVCGFLQESRMKDI